MSSGSTAGSSSARSPPRRGLRARMAAPSWPRRCASGPLLRYCPGQRRGAPGAPRGQPQGGGVAGAGAAAADAGWERADLMTLDVGGTSADIGVIRGGRPVLSSEEHIADFPLLIPTIAVSSIGAGGGSILWLDPTGALKVGPRSVGADPGPASYGLSEMRIPALTDAFLVAGLLAPGQRLGGKLPLQMAPARDALDTLAGPLGLSVEEVADGAIRVANALMAAEASNVLARRGVDAPQFRMGRSEERRGGEGG